MNYQTELTCQRIDIWLWHARIYKSRSISHFSIKNEIIKINSKSVIKPATLIKKDDIITIPRNNSSRVIQVLGFSTRRVSAKLCHSLYKEILEK